MPSLRTLLAVLALAWTGFATAESVEQVNINTADAETIARILNGVGLKKAEAIVRYRETHGRFDSPSDLTRVKGIGPAIVEKNEAKIAVSGTPGEEPIEKPPTASE